MSGDRSDRERHGRSFGSVAEAYARLRPGYPGDVVEFVLGSQAEPYRVLDLGAGTGRLTEAFLTAGHEVVAVDPAVEMLDELSARHPEVRAAVGTAESIPLRDNAVEAVVAGQAAHWFDLPRAAVEIERVLRLGGPLGLIWNLRDERVPWVAELGTVLASEDNHMSTALAPVAHSLAQHLGWTVHRAEFSYAHALSPEEVVAGLATRSYVVLLEPAARLRLLTAAEQIMATHPDTAGLDIVEFPYRTFAYRITD